MSCSIVDVKAYFLGELEKRERAQVESHLGTCADCREELERLGLMRTALLTLAEEEVPRRIAFVSDKVFEPHWWQAMWRSGPAMGFASAALLAGAILVHGFTRQPVTIVTGRMANERQVAASADTAAMDKRIEEEVAKRVDASVAQRIAEVTAQQKQQTAQLLEASEKRYAEQRRKDLVELQQVMRYQNQQVTHWMVASNEQAVSRSAQ